MASNKSRSYRKRKRAESEAETHRRITEAAVELHRTLGPAHTKLTELAERAGVSRATLYNHFPTQVDLFTACSTHWAAQNPFPDPSRWATVADPSERLGGALRDLYRWYGDNRQMLGNVLRDAAVVPALAEVMDGFWDRYMEDAAEALTGGWEAGGDAAPLRAAVRLVVDFRTWELLAQLGLDTDRAAALSSRMVGGVAARGPLEPSREVPGYGARLNS